MYLINEPIPLSINATVNGVLTDPTTVTLKVVAPNKVQTNYVYPTDITRQSLGVYVYTLVPSQAGRYRTLWITSGIAADEAWDEFDVALVAFS